MIQIIQPNKKDIKKWVKALRSGKYLQGYDSLQPSANNFCCLGVACVELIPKDFLRCDMVGGRLRGALPVAQPAAPLWLQVINESFDDLTGVSLMDLNDSELFSFDEIADLLEAVYIYEVLA